MTTGEREAMRTALIGLGFDVVRFAPAAAAVRGGFDAWLLDGHHADMDWLERGADKRRDVNKVVPGARSVIALGVNYAVAGNAGSQKRWAKYVLYDDYHDTIGRALKHAGSMLEDTCGATREDYRGYVDTGPVLERGWAAAAGLGWQGKNAMLISREFSNWLFLAVIVTALEIPPDEPLGNNAPGESPRLGHHCGSCRRCLEACPTDAFPQPGLVDARRCISFQTIENRGIIPRDMRRGIGPRIFGCDVCLDVCPWNRFAKVGRSSLLHARHELAGLTLLDLLTMDQPRFSLTIRKTAVKRTKLTGLLRNACIAAGNWRDSHDWHFGDVALADVLEQLVRLCRHESPIVRVHAVWAFFNLVGREQANSRLAGARDSESDPAVKNEYEAWEVM